MWPILMACSAFFVFTCSWWRLWRPRLWRSVRPVLETLRLKLCAFTFCMCDSTGHYKALFVALDSTFPLTHCPHRTPVWTPAACLLRNELHRWHSMKRCQWPLPLQAAGRADGRLLRLFDCMKGLGGRKANNICWHVFGPVRFLLPPVPGLLVIDPTLFGC